MKLMILAKVIELTHPSIKLMLYLIALAIKFQRMSLWNLEINTVGVS
jgi:hypothetical protein